MCVSCLSSLSPASSSSKVTRAALNRDFFGGAGVRDGSSSGRSADRAHDVQHQSQAGNNWKKSNLKTWFLPSMVTTSLCCSSLCPLHSPPPPPPPPSPLLLSGRRTTLAAAGAPEVRNCCCSLRRSTSESVGWGRRSISLRDAGDEWTSRFIKNTETLKCCSYSYD